MPDSDSLEIPLKEIFAKMHPSTHADVAELIERTNATHLALLATAYLQSNPNYTVVAIGPGLSIPLPTVLRRDVLIGDLPSQHRRPVGYAPVAGYKRYIKKWRDPRLLSDEALAIAPPEIPLIQAVTGPCEKLLRAFEAVYRSSGRADMPLMARGLVTIRLTTSKQINLPAVAHYTSETLALRDRQTITVACQRSELPKTGYLQWGEGEHDWYIGGHGLISGIPHVQLRRWDQCDKRGRLTRPDDSEEKYDKRFAFRFYTF